MKFTKNDIRKSMLLYAVTDRAWLKDGETLVDAVEEVLKNGATFMQVREKDLCEEAFEEESAELQALCRKYRVPFVINDNIDIAVKIKADGVHVGQSDIKGRDIRKIIGDDMILGISVGTVEEALAAEKAGADYVGVGAVFATGTKSDAGMVTGDMLKAIVQAIDIPVVAIGGIGANNLGQLKGTGIDGIAVVSAIFAAEEPGKATARLLELAKEAFGCGNAENNCADVQKNGEKAQCEEVGSCESFSHNTDNGIGALLGTMLENVRKSSPLIHNITNYVTVNDCANILLACGGSPIMADDADETEEITAICSGLNINIGTLNRRTIPGMFKAGKKANELGHPVVLDPVGAGASVLRTDTARRLCDEIDFAVIKGNISEIKTLAGGESTTRGVDADVADAVTEASLAQAAAFVKTLAARTGAVIAVTGAIDIVASGEKAYAVYNGHPMMSAITGTGCQLSAMTAAYAAANPENMLEAVTAAVCAMGIAGEIAYESLGSGGNASYRNGIIDAVYRLDAQTISSRAKVRMI